MEILTVFAMIVLIALALTLFRLSAGKKGTKSYDERQLYVRGKGYQIGFMSMSICLILVMMAEGSLGLDMRYVGSSVCLFVGLTTYAVYSVWNDAFLSLGQKPGYYLILSAVIVVCNLMGPVGRWMEGESLEQMLHSVVSLNLMCALCFLAVGISISLKMIRDRNEEQ